MLKVWSLTLLFIKPIIDLRRLIRNDPKLPHQMMSGLNEIMTSKQIEVVGEAFPQAVVQYITLISDYLLNGEVDFMAIASIVISALTAAYSQAVIALNGDVDPDRRETASMIYGYVPDSKLGRNLVLLMSTLFGACQLLVRCFSFGLYYFEFGGIETLKVMACEFALMLVGVWMVHGTLWTWLPFEGFFAVVAAVILRLIHYVTTTTSPFLQLRHPYDLGGCLFTCTIFLGLASSWLMVWRVMDHWGSGEGAEGSEAFVAGTNSTTNSTFAGIEPIYIPVDTIVAGLTGLHLLGFVGFLLSINRSHLHTFWWMKSNREFNVECYWKDKPDKVKWGAVCAHKSHHPRSRRWSSEQGTGGRSGKIRSRSGSSTTRTSCRLAFRRGL